MVKEFITKAHYPIQSKYKIDECHACGMDILVDRDKTAPRNYCSPCAWTKLGETNYVVHSE
jgi:hypothetical protein